MSTIGQFKATEKGYEGEISTLTMKCKVSFIPNENKKNEDSMDFFLKSGDCDLGLARHVVSRGKNGQPFHLYPSF